MRHKERGQIVLVLVLITVVGLTVGLSLIARTISDIRISSQIEQSSRAFSAAEAGVESALRGSVSGSTPSGSLSLEGASANYSVENIGGTSDQYNFPLTDPGKSQVVWLINHNSDDTLDLTGYSYPYDSPIEVCWGSKEGSTPAVEMTFIYYDGSDYKIAKTTIDSTNRGNNFGLASDRSGGYCSGQFSYRHSIVPADYGMSATDKLIMMHIQPVYEATSLAVKPGSNLPVQGVLVTSVGQTQTGNAAKIEVNRGYPIIPSLFSYTLFSEN